MPNSLICRIRLLMLCLVSATPAYNAAQAGSVFYDVVIDTSSFMGQSGDVEFQLGGNASSVAITASFSNYDSDAVLNGSTVNLNPTGAPGVTVTGDLSSTVSPLSLFNDDTAFQVADADQLVTTFGTFLNFRVTLTGDGIGAASAGIAALAISFFDGSGNPLFSGPDSINYAAVFIETSTDGTSTFTQYPVNSVPEPSSLITMLTGALGIGFGTYRQTSRPKMNEPTAV